MKTVCNQDVSLRVRGIREAPEGPRVVSRSLDSAAGPSYACLEENKTFCQWLLREFLGRGTHRLSSDVNPKNVPLSGVPKLLTHKSLQGVRR